MMTSILALTPQTRDQGIFLSSHRPFYTMTTAALSLPVVSVQNTFPHVIQDVEDGLIPYDKFWVSCYKSSEPSIHAKVKAELDHLNRSLVRLESIEGDVDISRDGTGVSAISFC